MSSEHGTAAILAAFFANVGIAIAKFVGFFITRSSAMLAESAHSVADAGNQALLLFGRRQARRQADEDHPFGYGRDRYFYAFVVALVLFSLGSLFSFYEAVHKFQHPEDINKPLVAVVILVVAIVMEAFSLRTAIRESREVKGDASWVAYIRRSRAPELPVVLLEDMGALVGLFFALGGISLAAITDNPRWDAAGTLAIAILLGVIAITLIIEMKSLLIGEGATPEMLARVREGIGTSPGVERIIHLRTLHLGPDELLVAAKLAMPVGTDLRGVASTINEAERRVREAVPAARVIYLEPDLDGHRADTDTDEHDTAADTSNNPPDEQSS